MSYHHGNLRAALLAAGREILELEGVGGVGLRRVARQVGVSHTAPYRHFQDVNELLASLAAQGFDELGDGFTAAAMSAGSGLDLLRRGGRAYVEFGLANPAMFRLMFTHHEPAMFEILRPSYEAAHAGFVAVVESAVAEGSVSTTDSDAAAAVAWSVVHGLVLLVIEGHLVVPPDPDLVIGLALDGIARRPAGS